MQPLDADKKTILERLLEYVQQRKPVIIVGFNNKKLGDKVTLHSQHLGIGVDGRFWKSVRHLGFGTFEGRTPHGAFRFEGGGAMSHYSFPDKSWISYSLMQVESEEVLKDLNYPFEEVEQALKEEISNL